MIKFTITPSLGKDLKMLQRLESIKDAYQREEVAFRLKVIGYHDKYGTEITVESLKEHPRIGREKLKPVGG